MPVLRFQKRLLTVLRLVQFETERAQTIHYHRPIDGDVVDHQHSLARTLVSGHHARRRGRGLNQLHNRQVEVKPESAAMSRAGFHENVAAHHADELTTDGQPQARASGTVHGIAYLLEWSEDRFKILCGDAGTAILHLESQ